MRPNSFATAGEAGASRLAVSASAKPAAAGSAALSLPLQESRPRRRLAGDRAPGAGRARSRPTALY